MSIKEGAVFKGGINPPVNPNIKKMAIDFTKRIRGTEKFSCYYEYVKKYYPNDVLIHIPKDKEKEIRELIRDYLIN